MRSSQNDGGLRLAGMTGVVVLPVFCLLCSVYLRLARRGATVYCLLCSVHLQSLELPATCHCFVANLLATCILRWYAAPA